MAILRYGDKIPERRIEEMMEYIAEYTGLDDPDDDDLRELCKLNPIKHDECTFGYKLVNEVYNGRLDDLIRLWRQHFVDTMQPQFLPEHWDVNHRPPVRAFE